MDIFFWWSVVSTILGVIFLGINVAQFFIGMKEKEIHKSQVKVWQHYAYGIQRGLFIATLGKFSSVDDVKEVIKAFQQNADSLYTSLNEERLFTDKEIKEQQLAKEREMKANLEQYKIQAPPTKNS